MSEVRDTPIIVAPARYVTIKLASVVLGPSEDAIRKRIARGYWREGKEWKRAPDGSIWVDLRGHEKWVEEPTV